MKGDFFVKRKHFTRIISIFTALALAACFAGCSQKGNDSSDTSKTDNKTASSATADNNGSSSEESKAEESSAAVKDEIDLKEEGPIPEIVDPTPDNMGEMSEGIFIYNGVAYEMFYGSEGMAKYYAETVSDIKKALGDGIKVYNVVVPTHVGVTLPDKFSDMCEHQDKYINTIVTSYTADVTGVDTFDKMMHHRDEYIYFNTDHHWTVMGAYYAYRAFTSAAGVEPVKLSDLDEGKIEGYYGSLSYFSGRDDLKEDYVTYYTSKDNIDCTKYDENGENPEDYMLIHSYAEGSNAYGVFLGGDTPILVTKNEKGHGKKIAVLKESYGNAFSPFMAYTYSEVHLIDFRYVNIDLKSYLEKNGIDEIVIINNTMASATDARCEELKALVGSSSSSDNTDDNTTDDNTTDENTTDEENDNNNYNEEENNDYTDENTEDYGNDENYEE